MTRSKPAVLLLDFQLPQLGEFRGLSVIRRLCPSTRTIFFTSVHDEKEVIRALRNGAAGCCNKEIEPSQLRKAVEVVQNGEVWVGRKTICQLLGELCSFTETGREECLPLAEVCLQYLSARERQIALSVGRGASNKEIANELNISERTVKAHLTSIFHKLKISGRLHLGLFVAGQRQRQS